MSTSIWAGVFVFVIAVEVVKLLTLEGGKKGNIEELFDRMAVASGAVPNECLAALNPVSSCLATRRPVNS